VVQRWDSFVTFTQQATAKRWHDILPKSIPAVLVSSQPDSMQLYQNITLCADKTSQHGNELWECCRSIVAIVLDCCSSTIRNAFCGSWISWSSLLLGSDSIFWDHVIYSCLSTRGICGENYELLTLCWHTTYQHRHTNNQTNHSDFESSPSESWVLTTVSLSELTVETLFHWQARPKTSFSQPWKAACDRWHTAHQGEVCSWQYKTAVLSFIDSVA